MKITAIELYHVSVPLKETFWPTWTLKKEKKIKGVKPNRSWFKGSEVKTIRPISTIYICFLREVDKMRTI